MLAVICLLLVSSISEMEYLDPVTIPLMICVAAVVIGLWVKFFKQCQQAFH
jgi:hypothetical protein